MKNYLFKKTSYCILLIAGFCSEVLLSGCVPIGSSGSDHLIPQEGLTVSQIYAQSGQGGSAGVPFGAEQDEDLMAARSQTANMTSQESQSVAMMRQSSPMNGQFQLVSNPSIAIYIYPHLVDMGSDEVPVNGYETAFFLYTKNHYALPWEKY